MVEPLIYYGTFDTLDPANPMIQDRALDLIISVFQIRTPSANYTRGSYQLLIMVITCHCISKDFLITSYELGLMRVQGSVELCKQIIFCLDKMIFPQRQAVSNLFLNQYQYNHTYFLPAHTFLHRILFFNPSENYNTFKKAVFRGLMRKVHGR